eukprot:9498805-Pyramimonas_sp.AAC.1
MFELHMCPHLPSTSSNDFNSQAPRPDFPVCMLYPAQCTPRCLPALGPGEDDERKGWRRRQCL